MLSGATYDVRAAAYAENGELGEWSDFARVDVRSAVGRMLVLSTNRRQAAGWFVMALGIQAWTRRSARRADL